MEFDIPHIYHKLSLCNEAIKEACGDDLEVDKLRPHIFLLTAFPFKGRGIKKERGNAPLLNSSQLHQLYRSSTKTKLNIRSIFKELEASLLTNHELQITICKARCDIPNKEV